MPVEGARHVAGARTAPAEAYDADIILLALNRAEETLEAIASALAQHGGSFHLFVLDQGSEPAILARFAEAIGGRRTATLMASGRNLGVAGGRNLASAFEDWPGPRIPCKLLRPGLKRRERGVFHAQESRIRFRTRGGTWRLRRENGRPARSERGMAFAQP